MMKMIKQKYHLEADRGLLNDPNGLVYFQGEYHVFFQWNRFKKDHSYKEWGHFVSADLISWDFAGSAILPDQSYDINGVYSGSSCVIQDQLYVFYTGNVKIDGQRKSRQCLAISDDGRKFLKKGPVLETPKEYTEHFRDPKVWKGQEGNYWMLVGGQRKNGKGAIALCSSKDGLDWKYVNLLATTQQYEMVECADLFQLDGNDVLLFHLQKRDNRQDIPKYSFAAYKIGVFDEKNETFYDANLDEDHQMLDYGFDFYAAQTFLTPDGRRLLFAWMSRMTDEQEKKFAENASNIHCLTLPRELSVQQGKLYQRPARELYQMLGKKIEMVTLPEGQIKIYPPARTFFLKIQGIVPKKNLCLDFYHGEAKLEYCVCDKKIVFSRRNWLTGAWESKQYFLDKLEEIELWSDNSSLEIFLNKGMHVLSSRIFPNSTESEITMKGVADDFDINVKEIKAI